LTEGVLLKRYKRFLADVRLASGEIITAHTPNTGAMLECSEPGRPVFLSYHDSPNRRYAYSWEMIAMPDSLVGVNTVLPNRLAHLALAGGVLTGGQVPIKTEREVRVGEGKSRLDLRALTSDGTEVLVEVKSCTLVKDGRALFPDAVSLRGAKHLRELMAMVGEGRRNILLVLVQRAGAEVFSPADGIDPDWGRGLREAVKAGVELMVNRVDLSLTKAAWGPALEASL
jgi:sugar fermentation stimulation protein A